MSIEPVQTYVLDAQRQSLLMAFGENDLAGTQVDLEPRTRHFDEVGLAHEVVNIAGATYFYPRTSEATRRGGSRTDLETLLIEFLYRHLKLEYLNE